MRNDYLNIRRKREQRYRLPNFLSGVNTALDERILPLQVAADCYNFDFSTGALRAAFGLAERDLGMVGITNVWQYQRYDYVQNERQTIVMFSTESGSVYYIPDPGSQQADNTQPAQLKDVRFTGIPLAVNYRLYGEDVIILCSEQDTMVVWNGKDSAYTVAAPSVTSMAMHYERMFVTVGGEKNAVWFSDDLDPTNWSTELDEGGFIQLMDDRGRLGKVISYLNYVYIFREYGISRLSAYADQSEFAVSNLFVSSGRIYPDSVTLCGDIVVFLAEDGLYVFDGLSTRKVLPGLSNIFIPSDAATAAYYSGKYHLALRIRTDAAQIGCEQRPYINNALLVFDPKTGIYSLSRGMDIRKLCPLLQELVAVTGTGRTASVCACGSLFGVPLQKKWTVPLSDFAEPDKEKRIHALHITTKYGITIVVRTETGEKTVAVKGGKTTRRVPIGLSGKRIGMDIIATTAEAEILGPLLHISKT